MEVITKEVFVKSATASTVSIGSRSRELIKQGLSNAVILQQVHTEFPNAKTTMACIAWYKSDMRKKGLLAPKGMVAKTVYLCVEDGVEREMTEEEVAEYKESQATE